jgi:hypothetical protein
MRTAAVRPHGGGSLEGGIHERDVAVEMPAECSGMWVNSGRATKEAASLVAACPAFWEVVFCDLEVAASLVDVAAAS